MKTSVFTFLILCMAGYGWGQSYVGLIIGNGVRIRTNASAKSKEVSKVNGMRLVTIIEEGKKWDALGETEHCEKHNWVKVQWSGDSTGWVYGKYCFKNDPTRCLLTKETSFDWYGNTYKVCIFGNYRYPVGDEEGLTGCGDVLKVMLYDEKLQTYYPIKDAVSKENETQLVLYESDGMAELIQQVSVKNNQLVLNVKIGYQEGKTTAVYTIQKKTDSFEVVAYEVAEVKY